MHTFPPVPTALPGAATRRQSIGLFGQFDGALQEHLRDHALTIRQAPDGDALSELVAGLDGIVIRSPFVLDDESARRADRLRWIVRAGSGTDNISPLFSQRGVQLRTTPITAHSVAELVLALVLGLLRNVRPAHASLQRGEWKKVAFVGGELRGRTVGIVGYGRLGRESARLLGLLGVRLVAYDRRPGSPEKQDAAQAAGVRFLDGIDEVLAQADIVVCCLPGTAETRHLFDAPRLARMRRGALLVNVGRGSLIDLEALTQALERGALGGAALDVFPGEPPGSLRLFSLDNVLCTPHLGAQTRDAHRAIAAGVIGHLDDLLDATRASAE